MVFAGYLMVTHGVSVNRAAADARGRWLLRVERVLRLDWELAADRWLARHELLGWLAAWEYATTYILTTFLLLGWLWWRRPERYPWARNTLAWTTLLAIICFAVIPTTPPRLLPGGHYADIVARFHPVASWGSGISASADQFAALPSLHIGWAAWVAAVSLRARMSRAGYSLAALHLAVTAAVVVATGNHYVLDIVAGLVLVWVAVAVERLRMAVLGSLRHANRSVRVAAPGEFFRHAETPPARQPATGELRTRPVAGRRGVALAIPRTLVLTGHFPPEPGGVQTFTWEFVRRLPPDRLVVVAPAWPGAAEFDAGLDFPVVRRHGYLLFRDLRAIVRRYRLEAGWVTAFAPFGLYVPFLRRAGLRRVVASSHGQEIGWIRAWPTKVALGQMARGVDTLTYLSAATRGELASVLRDRTELRQLAGGVDAGRFRPDDAARAAIRDQLGLGNRPIVVSVSRLVRRKGQDMLLRAWPDVLAAVPGAALLIVGDGPTRRRLAAQAEREFADSVVVTGMVSPDRLPGYYAAADLFALPCRDDRGGLQTEGLGLSALEAAATGLPVVVGQSGGSPASVRAGETGLVVDATKPGPVAAALVALLRDPELARRMGAAGRAWIEDRWSWERAAQQLAAVLSGRPTSPSA